MTLITAASGDTHGILPNEIGILVTEPVRKASVAFQVSTVVSTSAHEYRVPVVLSDAAAAFVGEADPITPSDATMTEIIVRPSKVAGLSVVSQELANDSAPSAQALVGEGLAQSIATAVDAAYFGNTTADGPSGLLSIDYSTVDTGGIITDTDVFAEAISLAEVVGATLTAFVAHPTTVLELSKIKRLDNSNEPLLNFAGDVSQPTRRQVLGVPIFTSTAVDVGTVWGIPQSKVMVVLRENVSLTVDTSAYFASDCVGVKARLRCGFAFPHEAAVVRLFNAGS